MSKIDQILKTLIVNTILLLAGTTSIIAGCLGLYNGNIPVATTGLGAGLLFLLSATIERFESIKGLGLEAKTRELNETIGKARHAVDELKQLAEISGHTLSLLAAKVGRWDSAFSFEENYTLASQIRNNLKSLDCDEPAIKKALEPWVKITLHDLARTFIQDINNATNAQSQLLNQEMAQIPYPRNADDPKLIELSARINAIAQHTAAAIDLPRWSLFEIEGKIEEYITNAPEISEALKQEKIRAVRSWKPEIEYLINNCELNNRSKWSEALTNS